MNKEKQLSMLFKEDTNFISAMKKMAGKNYEGYDDLKKDILFTKEDVIGYIKRNHLAKKIFSSEHLSEPNTADGQYLVKEGDSYVAYSKERGIQTDRKTFATEAEARSHLEIGSASNHDEAIERWVERNFGMYFKK